MKIKYINTDEDIKYMKEVLAKEGFHEGFKATRKIRLRLLMMVLILLVVCMTTVNSVYFKVFFSFILLILYLGFIGIILSQLTLVKYFIEKAIDEQISPFIKKFTSKEDYFSELIVDGNEIIIKSNNNERHFWVTFIKEIKEKNNYVYFKCIDDSCYFINCKYFQNRDKVNEFINFIKINSNQNLNEDLNKKIKQNNMIDPIKSMSYCITRDNLLSRYKYGKSMKCCKEITQANKKSIFTLQIVVLSLLTVLAYSTIPIVGIIILIICPIILYLKRRDDSEAFYRNLKKSVDKSILLDTRVKVEIDEANIYIYNKYTFKKYNLNKEFKAFEFDKFVLVTFLDLAIIASIPYEAFDSENDKKEFIDLFEPRESLEKKQNKQDS